MLEIWLATKTTASWKELYGVIDSPAVSGGQAVIKGEYILSISLCSSYLAIYVSCTKSDYVIS